MPIIEINQLSKRYQLGVIGSTTFKESLERQWHRWRGRDPRVAMGKVGYHHHPSRPAESPDAEELWALHDVSFSVEQGEVVGLIGRNGAGKSTLLKILTRITEPTGGRAVLRGRVASLLEVGTGFHPELTGRENVFLNGAILGMKKAEITAKFDQIVDFAEIERFIDTPVKRYSSGMYVRLAFAVAAHLDPEILLIDEVLAVGDVLFQEKCLGKMKEVAEGGRTVIFVSHNMAAVRNLCTKGVLLNAGRVEICGSVEEVIETYLGGQPEGTATFAQGPIRRASVVQEDSHVLLEVQFETNQPLRYPNLGFLISDYLGNPICGANPYLQGIKLNEKALSSGVFRMRLNAPMLKQGHYRLGLWFGNGQEDLIALPNCLQFGVVNIHRVRQQASNLTGWIEPACEWSLDTLKA